MWRILVFLLVLSQGAFANPAIEVLKAGFEEALNKVKVLQADILKKHIDIQQKQADLEATIQTVENLKLRLDGVESDANEKVKKVEQRANQHTNTKTAQVDSKANAAQNTADDAKNRANKAVSEATIAQKTANTAVSKANAAQNTANNAIASNKIVDWCDCKNITYKPTNGSYGQFACSKGKFVAQIHTMSSEGWCPLCIMSTSCCRPCKLSK